jgi:GNAT superfamily N-acetyltransferase
MEASFVFADVNLARRLEKAEALSNADFVTARAKAFPHSGAQWIEVAGAYAMYDGISSPATQTFGLGLFDTVTAAHLEQIEAFFQDRGAPVYHEVSPLAEPDLLALLNRRGYQPMEFTSVLYCPLQSGRWDRQRHKHIQVRVVDGSEQDLWASTAARGWSEVAESADFMLGLAEINVNRAGTHSFLAQLQGQPIAAGGLSIHEGVALLAGASTIPEARRQGAQQALLDSRLQFAVDQGCDLAMMGALPGSASQRNAERQGFRIAYTRIKWQLPQPASYRVLPFPSHQSPEGPDSQEFPG